MGKNTLMCQGCGKDEKRRESKAHKKPGYKKPKRINVDSAMGTNVPL